MQMVEPQCTAPQCTSIFQAFVLSTSANIPLTKASHITESKIKKQGRGLLLWWQKLQSNVTKDVDIGIGKELGPGPVIQSTTRSLHKCFFIEGPPPISLPKTTAPPLPLLPFMKLCFHLKSDHCVGECDCVCLLLNLPVCPRPTHTHTWIQAPRSRQFDLVC